MNIPDEEQPFQWDQLARERDEKKQLLRYFFENDGIETIQGVPRLTNKFLYLFGEQNTGKITLLKEVAKDVLGENWESKVYLRIDDGQRYPYKLHAHKVESSQKVILVTNKRAHWLKWKELYPITKTFFFEGEEIVPNTDGTLVIQFEHYSRARQNSATEFKQTMETLLQQQVTQGTLTQEVKNQLTVRLRELFSEFLRTEHVFNHQVFIREQ